MGIFGFWTEGDWSQNSYYGNNTKCIICFFTDGHLWGKDTQQACLHMFQEHCDISGVNLKQWSHYNGVTESQGVIHITVYYGLYQTPFRLGLSTFFPVALLESEVWILFLFGCNWK